MNGLKRLQCVFLCLILLVSALLGGCAPKDRITYNFRLFEYTDHATAAIESIKKYKGDNEVIRVPSEYQGMPVTDILPKVYNSKINTREVIMDSVEHIWDSVFENCHYLTKVELGKVRTIGTCAFRNCWKLETITFPDTLQSIEHGAFLYCTALTDVYFEGSPETIGLEVFDPGVRLHGPAGSYVEEYAAKYGYEFISWEPDADAAD